MKIKDILARIDANMITDSDDIQTVIRKDDQDRALSIELEKAVRKHVIYLEGAVRCLRANAECCSDSRQGWDRIAVLDCDVERLEAL